MCFFFALLGGFDVELREENEKFHNQNIRRHSSFTRRSDFFHMNDSLSICFWHVRVSSIKWRSLKFFWNLCNKSFATHISNYDWMTSSKRSFTYGTKKVGRNLWWISIHTSIRLILIWGKIIIKSNTISTVNRRDLILTMCFSWTISNTRLPFLLKWDEQWRKSNRRKELDDRICICSHLLRLKKLKWIVEQSECDAMMRR